MFKSRNAHQGIHKRSPTNVYHLFGVEDKSSLLQCPAELNEAGASLLFTDVDGKDVFTSSIHGHAKGAGLVRSQSFPPEGWYKTTSKYILRISKALNSEHWEKCCDNIGNELEEDLRCGTSISELQDASSGHASPMMVETACVTSLVPEQMSDKPIVSEDCEKRCDEIGNEFEDLRCRISISEHKDASSGPDSPMMVEISCVTSLVPDQMSDKPIVSEPGANPSLVGLSTVESLVGCGDAPALTTAGETSNAHRDNLLLLPNLVDTGRVTFPRPPVVAEESVSGTSGPVIPPSGKLLVCGRRREMEDTAAIVPSFFSFGRGEAQPGMRVNFDWHFYAVYDGHGGSQASTYCMERLHLVIAEELLRVTVFAVPDGGLADGCNIEWEEVMKTAFSKMDKEVGGICPNAVHQEGDDDFDGGCHCCEDAITPENAGTTAVLAVVGPYQIVVANCGDSRAVLARGGQGIPLSRDHKPELEEETRRIEAAGGRIICWDGYRVGGLLALSRALGDRYLKRYVISEPEIMRIQRSEDDDCLILASDGLWDVVSNEFACEVARKSLHVLRRKYAARSCAGEDAASAAVAALLVKLAYGRGSKDNISVVVVDLKSREMNHER